MPHTSEETRPSHGGQAMDARLKRANDAYVADLIKNNDYDFRDMLEDDRVLNHAIRRLVGQGDAKGYPKLKPNEKIPSLDDIYEVQGSRIYRKFATKPHTELQFLRHASVNGAVLALKNRGVYVICVKAKDMPNGQDWDNFAQGLYTFWVEYCYREGLTLTSDKARRILLYIFYGMYKWVVKKKVNGETVVVEKQKPVLFWLHKKVRNGRSRFCYNVETYFKDFIALVQRKKYHKYLRDRGEGNVPMEYLVAFELGLRNYSLDVHAMGTSPLRTPWYWGHIDLWRKREAYIALGRHLLGYKPNYQQWDCFLWTDYVCRQLLGKTFLVRHYPLTDGDDEANFGDALKFDWDKHAYAPVKPEPKAVCNSSKTGTGMVTPPSKKKASDKPMIYDVEKGCLIPWT